MDSGCDPHRIQMEKLGTGLGGRLPLMYRVRGFCEEVDSLYIGEGGFVKK